MLYPPGKQNMRQNLEIIKTVFPFIDSMLKAVCTLGKKIPPPKNKNEHQQSIRFNTIWKNLNIFHQECFAAGFIYVVGMLCTSHAANNFQQYPYNDRRGAQTSWCVCLRAWVVCFVELCCFIFLQTQSICALNRVTFLGEMTWTYAFRLSWTCMNDTSYVSSTLYKHSPELVFNFQSLSLIYKYLAENI